MELINKQGRFILTLVLSLSVIPFFLLSIYAFLQQQLHWSLYILLAPVLLLAMGYRCNQGCLYAKWMTIAIFTFFSSIFGFAAKKSGIFPAAFLALSALYFLASLILICSEHVRAYLVFQKTLHNKNSSQKKPKAPANVVHLYSYDTKNSAKHVN